MPRQCGFSLIELAIATAVMLAMASAVFALVHPSNRGFDSRLEIADQQQRVRVAVDTLTRDLTMAGAGAYMSGRGGPLIHHVAPVLPFQWKAAGGDPPDTFRPDAITVVSVPSTAAQTTLASDLTASELILRATPNPGCAAGINLCGFAAGMTVLVFDDTGSAGVFTIAAVEDAAAEMAISAWPVGSETTIYRRGASVVEAKVHGYYLKTDVAAQTFQLMHSDGSASPDVPVLDHVVGLSFQYDGEPRAPVLTAAGDTSYGPAPPESSTGPTAYPAGENCVFRLDETSGQAVSRLASLTAGTALTPLTAATLTDGPWCPDAENANRWDADLLRIRTIGVTVRIQAAPAALRGPANALFANGGTSRDVNRWVPDQEIRFQVSPRNMNLERE